MPELFIRKTILVNKDRSAVFNPAFLRNPEGKFSGYPYRNEVKASKLEGYSDHFPVYVLIGKKGS